MSAIEITIGENAVEVPLVGIGTSVAAEFDDVRIWDVDLPAGALHSWHLHRNPYVVLSIIGSTGRMDWIDGAPPRDISEYTGGAVFRPVSPVHRLWNTGGHRYRNHLIELKQLGELRASGPYDVGVGARSVEGELPEGASREADGRMPTIVTEFVRVWTVAVPARGSVELDLDAVPHLLVELAPDRPAAELGAAIRRVAGGPARLQNPDDEERSWFVVALDYQERSLDD